VKILHVSDLHFRKHWFKWLKSQKDNFDIFCISGDFLDDLLDETLEYQINWITDWLSLFEKPLFVCSGNHDIDDLQHQEWLTKIPNIYSDNSIKTIDGIKFGCIPYLAPSFQDFDECDIILYHLPPSNTNTAINTKHNVDCGDEEIYRAIKNKIITPKILFCGHVHHPKSTVDKLNNTTIYNTGVNKNSTIPNHHIIEIKE
jgi:Icc-related predicted phosphoesterase